MPVFSINVSDDYIFLVTLKQKVFILLNLHLPELNINIYSTDTIFEESN
jgi:hypothetical protein